MAENKTCLHLKRNKEVCGKRLTGVNLQRGYCAGCYRTVKKRLTKNTPPENDLESPIDDIQAPSDFPVPPGSPIKLEVPVQLNSTDIYPDEDDLDAEVIQIRQSAPVKQVLDDLNTQSEELPPRTNTFVSEDDFVDAAEDELSENAELSEDKQPKSKASTLHVINDGITLTFNVISSLPNMQGFGAKVQQMAPGSLKHLVIEMCHEENYCAALDNMPASQKLLLLLGGAMMATYLENTKAQTPSSTTPTDEIKPQIFVPLPQPSPYDLLAKPNENKKQESMINMNLI